MLSTIIPVCLMPRQSVDWTDDVSKLASFREEKRERFSIPGLS